MNLEIPASKPSSKISRLERRLAKLLHYGTWLASSITAVGLLLAPLEKELGTGHGFLPPHLRVVTLGIALFILLPVLRVTTMLAVFLRERDYLFSLITALVLAIILAGFWLGLSYPAHGH